MTPDHIQKAILRMFPDGDVEITGDGHHFEATVVSAAFEGKTTLERHRMVYSAVNDDIQSGALHALSLKTRTPTE